MKYVDAIIPAHEKDIDTVGLCAEYIKNNVENIRNVYVVSKYKLTDKAIWVSEDSFPFTLQNVADIIGKHRRTCWYYAGLIQQTCSLVIPNISNNVLVCDSDTMFVRKTKLYEENKALFNVSYDLQPNVTKHPYLEYVEKLVPGLVKQSEYSGIVHHMPVQKDILQNLFKIVEDYHGVPFWKASIKVTTEKYETAVIDNHSDGEGRLSTYDLYYNFVYKYHRDRMKINPRKSILAYKGLLGVDGYLIHNFPSRSNLFGNVTAIPIEEQKEFKFDNIISAMSHISERAAFYGWDAITFQNHTRIGSLKNKEINTEYILKHSE